FDYRVHEILLRPGDRLCMVTDGITEAMDGENQLFGSVRLREALAGLPPRPAVREITAQIRGQVGQFVAGAEPSDDLAILVLHWIGRPQA
ncbi:MAG: SpoIIE family protein phosphatase, partial [Burkholderiaceae bacterium]